MPVVTFILDNRLTFQLKKTLTCRIAISFASWLMWLSEREDTRSSTEKDIVTGVKKEKGDTGKD